ncbi:GNAT family N-acetyltransferase [Streptococcus castoreus]|uniref:GNAT family N-acetyltransferase n=1 Tax=Streptococcus castoreus TaxID=254786 RepID=UPI0004880ED8|nr:GNAT family N-acetyltransferase [Streptococcus castoreus]
MIIRQTRNTLADTYLDAVKIRQEVFVKEQGVPISLEIDQNEAYCLHFVLYDKNTRPCATCRLLPHADDFHQVTLQRMAVLKTYRHQGIGKQLISYILDDAQRQGITKITLHAQLSAQTFYTKLGFQAKGDRFDEAGIDHITMEKNL